MLKAIAARTGGRGGTPSGSGSAPHRGGAAAAAARGPPGAADTDGPRPYEAHGMTHVKWLGVPSRAGRVQLSVDELGHECVLKLEDNPATAEYQVEVMKAFGSGSEHVVMLQHYYPASAADPRACLQLALLPHDLERHIKSVGTVMGGLRRDIARSLLEALAYIHGVRTAAFPRGIVHGDIKPLNVMMDAGFRVRLIDFDEARGVGTSVAVPRPPGVTLEYTSPEMYRARVGDFCEPVLLATEAHDIACAGLVLWKLLDATHRPAFETEEEAIAALGGTGDVVDVERIDTGVYIFYARVAAGLR